ncbi:MAG: T9SS type A sorting domain-containing protein [Candidatus Latescibacteria bacterium]|nr:T9SS type A sorting domain-containing protein [Candidatus Latescibacterota bacterium]
MSTNPLDALRRAILGAALLLTGPVGAQPFFDEVTHQALGRLPMGSSWGSSWGDYDNDGRVDLFLRLGPPGQTGRAVLAHNEGDGRFGDQTALIQAPLALGFSSLTSSGGFADYDNDGDLDAYVTAGNSFNGPPRQDILLRNERSVFRDVTAAAGLDHGLFSNAALWLDYDRDGHLDLLVNYTVLAPDQAPATQVRLQRNEGDGTFTDQSQALGTDLATMGLAADFNNDGWTDLYSDRKLLLNDGTGGFVDATTDEIAVEAPSNGKTMGDIDNDGDLDILQLRGGHGSPERSVLFLNLGDGIFADFTEGLGLDPLHGIDAGDPQMADIDNDGDLDIVLGFPQAIFLNDGTGFFAQVLQQSALEEGVSLIWGDYDGNGFVDLLKGVIWPAGVPQGPGRLYRNRGNANHWLHLDLVGVQSNRSALGARVLARTGDRRQMRQLVGGTSDSQSELGIHFGLGTHTRVEQLEIVWPSGQVDILTDIAADQRIRLIEGQGRYHPVVPAVWLSKPPTELVGGTQLSLDLRLQPALFHEGAEITEVVADLSDLGGPSGLPMQHLGDSTFGLQTGLTVDGPSGWRQVAVLIEQDTEVGSYWTRLSSSIQVGPGSDLELGAAEWNVAGQWLDNLTRSPDAWDHFPAWSPDGARVSFASFGDNTIDVYERGLDDTALVKLTHSRAWDLLHDWSPDGRLLAFSSQRDGNDEIYTVEAEGTNPINRTSHPANDQYPGWAPDGARIAFQSDRDGQWDIFIMAADGANQRNLTDHPGNDNNPVWSPDGTKIAFSSDRDGQKEVYVIDADGSNLVRLTDHPSNDSAPTWAPDGTKIAFSSDRYGRNEIFMMNTNGTNPVNLTQHPWNDEVPRWSPDGRHLAFTRSQAGFPDIYVMEMQPSDRLVLHPQQQQTVYRGPTALQVEARHGQWQILYQTAEPVDLAGYKALHLAFHGGDVDWAADASLQLATSAGNVELLGPWIDPAGPDWQTVELPLYLFAGADQAIQAVNITGNLHGTFYLDDIRLVTAASSAASNTAVEERADGGPGTFALAQNYPNPFNSGTTIRFSLPTAAPVELELFNLAGQKVATLAQGLRPAGSYTLGWDGRDEEGRELASGLYLYRLQAGQRVETRKLLLLR